MHGDDILSVSDFGTMMVTQPSNTSGEGSRKYEPNEPFFFALKWILELPGRETYVIPDLMGNLHFYNETTFMLKLQAETESEIK